MALWKESTQTESLDERNERPPQDLARVTQMPQRKESRPKDSQESVFGAGLTIEGKIEGDGDVRIAGQFKGDAHVKGDLSIEKGAHITGKIHADTVIIGGELDGNIVASSQVKLLESGQLIGDLKATTLTVAAGSRMRGNVEFGWDDLGTGKVGISKAHEKGGNGSAL
ncbi:MAG: polymer-forming cytoskeletal protein [Deltaproteobacteria bacterium]|nr:MAG: polymer-forming cytoskeletal protein [Deltaproteobacteria bacterium]